MKMTMNKKRCLTILSFWLLFSAIPIRALIPVFDYNNKTILLKVEHIDDGLRTYYNAVATGAEMWIARYYSTIIKHCTTTTSFYKNLPGYGYTQVTSTKLANLLLNDPELSKRGYTSAVRDRLIKAMDDDRHYGRAKKLNEYWDPKNDWKWRYTYMINRMTTSSPSRRGNCFGTTSYLTKSHEWILAYQEISNRFTNIFPEIILPGVIDEGFQWYFDRFLKGTNFGYADTAYPGKYYGYYLNAFDIIRFSGIDTGYTDLIMNVNGQSLNLGSAQHAVVYLCTDRAGNPWIFEKGVTAIKPPAVVMLTNTHYAVYQIVTLFYHKNFAKELITDITEEDWAGVITR